MIRNLLLVSLLATSVYGGGGVPPVNVTELTAAVIVAEAGGEGREGMGAVCEVIRNRMKARNISMYRVVTERYAFSCYNKYRGNPQGFIAKWKKHPHFNYAKLLVEKYHGNGLTKGSCFYHEKSVKPSWSRGVPPTTVIKNHLFFASIKY